MENRFYDEKNGLWYEREGEYFLPCVKLSEEEQKPVGIWGRRHLRYIKQYKCGLYTELLTSGELNGYLAGVDEQAEKRFEFFVKQFAENDGVTEALKAENQMLWVQRVNGVRARATEVVNVELIYI